MSFLLLGALSANGCSGKPAAPARSPAGRSAANAEPAASPAPPAPIPAHAAAGPAAAASASPGAPAGGPGAAPVPAVAPTATGTIVETMDAAGGTYLRIDTGAEKIWVATNKMDVKVGDRLVVRLDMPMRNFHSGALNRDFPLIYFASRVSREAEASAAQPAGGGQATAAPRAKAAGRASAQATPVERELPPGHPMPGGQAMPPGSGMPPPHPPIRAGEITVTDVIPPAPGGHSVAEVWAERAALAGKTVVVRGRVVKFLSGIMGRNWMHLQDGTGTAANGTRDITVTTAADAKPGDVVTATGTLAIDKDFGAGYRYGAIVENATISK